MEYTKVSAINKLINYYKEEFEKFEQKEKDKMEKLFMYWEKKYSKLDWLNTLSIKENGRPMTESEYNFELMWDSDGWNSD